MPIQQFTNPSITHEQAQVIVDILIRQCNMIEARDAGDRAEFPELYDDDYSRGRNHSDTASVLAGFQPNTTIPDMTITKRNYGLMHCQPELESDTAVVQIYSDNASLNTREIRTKCSTYNVQNSNKRFCVFQFRMSKSGHLTSVDLLTLDERANVVLKENIYAYRARIIQASA